MAFNFSNGLINSGRYNHARDHGDSAVADQDKKGRNVIMFDTFMFHRRLAAVGSSMRFALAEAAQR